MKAAGPLIVVRLRSANRLSSCPSDKLLSTSLGTGSCADGTTVQPRPGVVRLLSVTPEEPSLGVAKGRAGHTSTDSRYATDYRSARAFRE